VALAGPIIDLSSPQLQQQQHGARARELFPACLPAALSQCSAHSRQPNVK